MAFFLGVDGGGSKTEAVLIDATGNEIARADSGPANYHSVGQGRTETSLSKAIVRVLADAGREASDVTAVCLGLAGAARARDRQVIQTMLSRIARFARSIITHDAETALVGGVGCRHGVVLVAGTGSISFGVNARGESRRADGWGHLLGDEGSAYWIGREGLRAAVRASEGRGPVTDLEARLFSQLGALDVHGLVERVYASRFGIAQVAALAPLVRQSAAHGDVVATGILSEAGRRLGATLCAVIRGLGMQGEAFEVALSGGVFRARDIVWESVEEAVHDIAPHAHPIEPRHDSAYGAALLARRAGA